MRDISAITGLLFKRMSRRSLLAILSLLGATPIIAAGALISTSVSASTVSTPGTTLALSVTAPGASCNNTNVLDPICSGLAGGDVVTVTGTGFTPGATASIVQCNSEPSQPVVLFLGQYIPVSCTALALTTISSAKATSGDLTGSHTMVSGVTGPPVSGFAPTCVEDSTTSPTTTSTIPGCTTSGVAATDALLYPCPPTPAQVAAGDDCVLSIGDTVGEQAIGTVLFGSETLPAGTGLTGPYELYCPGTPVGNVVMNDVTTSAAITPSNPGTGETFDVTNYQTIVDIPATLATAAAALGNTALAGSATTKLDVFGATPESLSSGTIDFSAPIPSPVPADGIALHLPSPPGTLGPFTASGAGITVDEASSANLTLLVSGEPLALTCSAYPNNSNTTGIATGTPVGNPIDPVIATSTSSVPPTSSTTTTIPVAALTGPYELYCPGTPVGDLAMNNVTTSATITPSSPAAGGTFNITNYQTIASFPAALASAAAALGSTLNGSATTQLDVSGATPTTMSGGTINFSVPIPNPVPASGLSLELPNPPSTIGPFTSSGNTITVAEDASTTLTIDIAPGSTLPINCTAYANNSVPTGETTESPSGSPIDPLIASVGGSTTSTALTGPYELYCPGTPVGNVVMNGVTTSAAITPSNPGTGETFDVTNYQTIVNIPATLAEAAAALGNTSLAGSATTQLDVSSATPSTMSSGTISFSVPIPNPVPADGIALDLLTPADSLGPFTATSSSISVEEDSSASLTLLISGNPLALTCSAYPNDSTPTGISTGTPSGSPIDPVIAVSEGTTTTGNAISSVTTRVSATSIELGQSSTVSDLATVKGNPTYGSPTGNATFYACQTSATQSRTVGACPATASDRLGTVRLGAETGDTSEAASATITPTAAGTWCLSAVYGGDTNYLGSSDNTESTNLDSNECFLVTPATSTTAGVTSYAEAFIGTSVNDSVTITGIPLGISPTGVVSFYACQTGTTQNVAAGRCVPGGSPEDSDAELVSGAGDTSSALSSSFTLKSPGTWCFSAVYEGDSNYLGSSDNTTTVDSNECVLVIPLPSTTASTISTANATIGSSVSDSVTVKGDALGGPPTGSVSFYMCQTGTAQTVTAGPCVPSGSPQDADVNLVTGPGNTSSAVSTSFTPTATGMWCFSAVYVGDAHYLGSSDNTSTSTLDAKGCVLIAPVVGDGISSADNASATAGSAFSFSIETYGNPVPVIKKTGTLPRGLHFVNDRDGKASISGTPNLKKSPGVYQLAIVAKFGTGKAAQFVTQVFTLTVT